MHRYSRLPRPAWTILLVVMGATSSGFGQADLPPLNEIKVRSSLDGTDQPVRYWAPDSATQESTVLFVFLHSWSSDYRQDNSKWLKEAVQRNWIFLHPNFRGANNSPQACGSKFARQDILDAMDFVMQRYRVDPTRVYLAGVSGGGHMSMLMAGHHPDRFSAVSAWVGISDLASWYRFHLRDGKPQKYAQMILQSLGSPPGTDEAVDADYRDRSPLFHIHNAATLPIDIFAGVNDGHTGSVPVHHSLHAFNRIAEAHRSPLIADSDIDALVKKRRLPAPRPGDSGIDPHLNRELRLRRTSGDARVTIFEGGHESVPAAALEWLVRQKRETKSP